MAERLGAKHVRMHITRLMQGECYLMPDWKTESPPSNVITIALPVAWGMIRNVKLLFAVIIRRNYDTRAIARWMCILKIDQNWSPMKGEFSHLIFKEDV